tara:strand:+ start:2652 stop:2771 length:120 start_codon:yes stop_codon:yes gene_type:complete
MSITDKAIERLKQENYSASVIIRKEFEQLQDELYGKEIG